jgi:feruloyl-CoA synthase
MKTDVIPEDCFAPVNINCERDGAVITLQNVLPPADAWDSTIAALKHWAAMTPDSIFLAERAKDGSWTTLSYHEAERSTAAIAAHLLAVGCNAERPLLIASPNSIRHAKLALAAQRVGVPVATVSLAYATVASDFGQLRHMIELIEPAAIYFGDTDACARAIADVDGLGTVIVDKPVAGSSALTLQSVTPVSAETVAIAESKVGSDSVARLLFTSGSTGKPKAVINTQRMLCSNQAMLQAIWPVVLARPPVLVDWLPWSHTFGANFTSNLVLCNGGTLYIDGGKPVPALIPTTLNNIAEVKPTAYFNVPAGYDAMIPLLERDQNLACAFFERLDFLFCAAAALPQSTRDRLQLLSEQITGKKIPILAGWGSTETAPCATATWFETEYAGNIGMPIPGVAVRLVPDGDKCELRVKGPTVTPGYWRAPEATKAAFDSDGFYRMGDAGKFVDEAQPELGILFDGRVSENFKLTSGTWVSVGALRLAVVNNGQPIIRDLVITGHDRASIGALIFVNHAACRERIGANASNLDDAAVARHPAVHQTIAEIINTHNVGGRGSSTRIERFLILEDAPRIEALEITDKGYINQRAVLTARADDVEKLYQD